MLSLLSIRGGRKGVPQRFGHGTVRFEQHPRMAGPNPPPDPVLGKGKFGNELLRVNRKLIYIVELEHLSRVVLKDVRFARMNDTGNFAESLNLSVEVLDTAL